MSNAILYRSLRQIDIEPALPVGRSKIINELLYTRIAQVFLQTKSRFWESKPLENVKKEIYAIWPDAKGQIETTLTTNWGQSYVDGAYAHSAPGQMSKYATEIPTPVGQIHFAGEHTELVAPGMEGALTSGKSAAAEILASTLN